MVGEDWDQRAGNGFPETTHLIKIIIRKHLARMTPLDSGTVDQDSNLMAVSEDPRDQPGDVLCVAQVGCVDRRGPAQGADGVARVGRGGVALVGVSQAWSGV